MKNHLQILATIFVALLCATMLSAQGKPNEWHGLLINSSNPADAIRLFGPPAKEKDKVALDLPRPLSWLSDKWKEKIFHTLTYKRLKDYKQVQFSFLDDKLVLISLTAPNAELEENWIDPDDLEQIFGLSFKPHQRKYKTKLPPPAEFQSNAPTELKKSEYDYWYDMIAVSENSYVVAIADNYQYQSGLFDSPDVKRRKKINARGARYPGYVSDIEIVSRILAAP
jgi:hypothetical protein